MKFELADTIDKLRIENAHLTAEIERLNFENQVLSAAGNVLRSKLEAQPEQEMVDTRCQLNGIAHLIHPITLNGHELRNALQLATDDLETAISIQYKQDGKDIDGEDAPAGYYAWYHEYPEEGSIRLDDEKSNTAPPAPQSPEQSLQQIAEFGELQNQARPEIELSGNSEQLLELSEDEIRAVYKKLWPGGPPITPGDLEFANAVLTARNELLGIPEQLPLQELSDDDAGYTAFQEDYFLRWGERKNPPTLAWGMTIDKPKWIAIARAVLAARSGS